MAESRQKLHCLTTTNPLLSSKTNLSSKYASTGSSKLLGQSSFLSGGGTKLGEKASTVTRSVSVTEKKESGSLSSASESSLSVSSSQLQETISMKGQGLRRDLSSLSSTATVKPSNYGGQTKLKSNMPFTKSSVSSTSFSTKSSAPLTTFTKGSSLTTSSKPLTSLTRDSSLTKSSVPLTSFTRGSSLMKSSVPLTSFTRDSSLTKSSVPLTSFTRDSSLTKSSVPLTSFTRDSSLTKSSVPLTSFSTDSKTSSSLTSQRQSSLFTFSKPAEKAQSSSPLLLTASSTTRKLTSNLASSNLTSKLSTSLIGSKTSKALLGSSTISKTVVSKPLSGQKPLTSSILATKPSSVKTTSLLATKTTSTSTKLVGSVGTEETDSPGPAPRPITADTEGAPSYKFSIPPSTESSKKQLFVAPELDASLQGQTTPIVDVVGLKTTMLNAVATSLLCSPNFHNPKDPTYKSMVSLGEKVALYDPEFLLKVAIYTRLNLNIRTTANFLLALAAKLPPCRPYLKKYFSASIRLPSDWIEVAEIYQAFQDENIKSGAIPTSLRKVMGSKFTEFDAFQLAKYNKDSKKKKKVVKPDKLKKAKAAEEEKKKKYSEDFPALKAADTSDDSDTDSSIVLSESETKEEIERLSFTMKQLIRKIHISEPVEYIMCLVGKKYPEDPESFRKSRLPGMWDSERAGKRMKLATPETWETQVSTKGNKAKTWQDLIDHNKLPFMAMLRNLRNLVLAGVSRKHHQWVIGKLNDERAVTNSRQFPFRFFSAYEVLVELEKIADGVLPASRARPGKPKKSSRKPTAPPPEIDKTILQKYKTALDNAVKIATRYNVKPIGGSTLILCNVGSNMNRPCTAARGLGKPRKVLEVGVLLGLMCKYSCENSTMLIYGNNKFVEAELAEGTILQNMEKVMDAATNNSLGLSDGVIPKDFLTDMVMDRTHVDNIVLLTDAMKLDDEQGNFTMDFLKKYRQFVNPQLLFVSVDLSGANSGLSSTITPQHHNDIYLAGYSDQILRFIAERGDSGQLTFVENIDKAHNLTNIKIPSLSEPSTRADSAHTPSLGSEKTMLSTAQGKPWRTVRVFISSTFKDMHGERDLLTRFVFPELRARAHSRQIHVYEVDLRWGVTEQDARSHKALDICLDEISRSQYFIGVLGERYGWMQDEYNVSDKPELEWVKEYPTRRSITDLEIHHAMMCFKEKSFTKSFFYLRDPSFLSEVPKRYKNDFEIESEEASENMRELKTMLLSSGLEVYNDYPCKWLGEVQNKPIVGGLESFGKRVLHNLWNAIQKDYPEDELEGDAISQANTQHNAFRESRASGFIGRRALLQKAKNALVSPENKVVLVSGKPGCGKSAFMAAVAQEHIADSHLDVSLDLVISHFVGAAPGSTNVAQILNRICHELRRRFDVTREIPEDYTDLASTWNYFLEDSVANLGKIPSKLVIMIDGVDLLEEKHNGRSLDWIPDDIPDGVVVLVSGTEGGVGISNLRKRKPTPAEVVIGSLDIFDKAEMVRKKLQKHRKTLDESPFNNQMKLLLTKKDAINPLYLHLACEELRVFGIFEEVTAYLKKMPTTIPNLLQEVLERLESEHTFEIISTSMILLTLVRNGLLEHELAEILQLALKELYPDLELSVSPMVISKLLRSLQTFLQPTGQETHDLLTLAHKDTEKAVRLRYTRGAASKKETQLHLILASFFRNEADPSCDATFKGNSARAFSELPYHLVEASAWKELEELVCNIHFVIAKCQLGLAQQLLEDYMPVSAGLPPGKTREMAKFIQQPIVQECKSFVSRNLHILIKTPAMALQQALNEPTTSSVATASREVLKDTTNPVILWVNKPESPNPCQINISSQTGAVLCVAVSPDSSLFAAGYKNGSVKVYEITTGKEVHTFIGHAAGITDVCFVGGNLVCSASLDTTLSVWDTNQGIRTSILKGHSRGVHGCQANTHSAKVVSVSWDTSIRVWDGRTGKIVSTIKTQGLHNTPINCVSFHPEGQLVVVGCWDTNLKIYDTLSQKRIKVLKGHKTSIQACAYAPSGRHIVSAALDGEVRIWSTRSGTTVGAITGHLFPVNGITFTPNGQFLATASSDKVVKVWSGSLGQPISSLGSAPLGFVHKIVCDPSANCVSVGYHDGHVREFNVQTGAELSAVKLHSSPIVGLAKHYTMSMTAYADGTIKLVDSDSSSKVIELKGHTSPITCAEWGKNGFASASDDFNIFLWPHLLQAYKKLLQYSVTTAIKKRGKKRNEKAPPEKPRDLVVNPLATLKTPHTGKITALAFSCDGVTMAAVSHDQSISLWSCMRQELTRVLHAAHKDWITTCTFSDSTPNILITGSSDFTLKVWDTNTGSVKSTFKGHTSAINTVAMSQGCVVSGAFDGSVKVWTHKGVEITTIHCHQQRVNTCYLHIPAAAKTNQLTSAWADLEDEPADQKTKMKLDEIMVFTGSDDGTVGVWKPFLPNEITSLIGHSDHVLSIASTVNNHFLSSSRDGSVRLWTPALPIQLRALTATATSSGHTGPVTSLSAMRTSENTVFAVSGGRDGYALVWEMTAEKVNRLHRFRPTDKAVGAVCLASQVGEVIVGNSNGLLQSYNFDRKQCSMSSTLTGKTDSPVTSLAMTTDGKNVIAGSQRSKEVSAVKSDLTKQNPLGRHENWVMDIITVNNFAYSIGLDNTICRWTVTSKSGTTPPMRSSLQLKKPHDEEPTWALSLCEVRGTNYLAISDNRGKVFLWNHEKAKQELHKKLHNKAVTVVCSVGVGCFVTGSEDSTVKVWRVERSGRSRVSGLTQIAQFYCQSCVTAISEVRGRDDKNSKPMLVVGDSLGHVTFLQLCGQ